MLCRRTTWARSRGGTPCWTRTTSCPTACSWPGRTAGSPGCNRAARRLLGRHGDAAAAADYREVLPLVDDGRRRTGGAASRRTGGCRAVRGQPGAAAGAARHPSRRAAGHRPRTSASDRGGPVSAAGRRVPRTPRARRRADRDRADLVSTVAHELRSPLTTVKGFTATLLAKWDRFTDEQKQAMLAAVNADADRVTRLLTDLLDVSRIDAGRLRLRPQVVDAAGDRPPGASPGGWPPATRRTGSLLLAAARRCRRPGSTRTGRPGAVATSSRTRSGTAPARSRIEMRRRSKTADGAAAVEVTVADEGAGIDEAQPVADLLPVLARRARRRHRPRPVHRQGHRRGAPRRDRRRTPAPGGGARFRVAAAGRPPPPWTRVRRAVHARSADRLERRTAGPYTSRRVRS